MNRISSLSLADMFRLYRKGKVTLLELTRLVLLKRYGFPDMFIYFPKAVGRLAAALFKPSPAPVYAFTSFDLFLRTFYRKLVRNFHQFGRWGFAWDEGLGFSMGGRFGSNWATYALYGLLPTRGFSLLSLAFFLIPTIVLGTMFHHIALAVVLMILLVGSPAIIHSLAATAVKPEIVWWSFAVPTFFAALQQEWTWVWILLGFLLLVNTSVSVLLGLVCGIYWIFSMAANPSAVGLEMLWLLPGVLVRGWRFWQAYRDGNLGSTVKEQSTAVEKLRSGRGIPGGGRRVAKEIVQQIVVLLIGFLPPLLIASWGEWVSGLILGGAFILVNLVNANVTKIADNVSVRLLALCITVAVCLFSAEWIGLLGVLLIVFESPFNSAWEAGGKQRLEALQQMVAQASTRPGQAWIAIYRKLAREAPWLNAIPFPRPACLEKFFNQVPDGSRILMEGDGEPRETSRFARFHDWTNEFLPDRQIEFINQTFLTRALEPRLAAKYLDDFAVPALKAETLHQVCMKLGVTHVITFRPDTTGALKEAGYWELQNVRHSNFADLADILYMPEVDLTLLANPGVTGIISPGAVHSRRRNTLSWDAQADQTYMVRYRFHPCFSARQGPRKLKIKSSQVFDDLPLRFISVRTAHEGRVELTFKARWI